MTVAEAKRTGSTQALIAGGAGIVIAQFIMTLFYGSERSLIDRLCGFWGEGHAANILIGIAILLTFAHIYGQIAGRAILISGRHYLLWGCLCGMAVLLSTALLCGWTGFVQEGIPLLGTDDNPYEDYIFKPFLWVSIIGLLPALLLGAWFGWRLRRRVV